MKVKEVMTKDVISVDKDVDLKYVMSLMKKYDITKIPVLEEKKLIGIITDNIIAYKLGSIRNKGVPASRMHASSVTDKKMEIIHPDTDLVTIIKSVGKPGLTMLPVVENDRLVGIVTKSDLLHFVDCKKKVIDIIRKELHIISSHDRVVHARRIMIDTGVARLPVLSDGELVGMISDTEIAFAFADLKDSQPIGRQKHKLDEILVRDYMKKPAIWANSSISASDAAKIMIKNNIGALPLMENGKIVGIVTRTDLLKTLPC